MASYYRCSECNHLVSVDDYTQNESYYDIDERRTLEHKCERTICNRNVPVGVNEIIKETPIGSVIKDVLLERRIELK